MKITEDKITTISKEDFDKLSESEKRISVIKDVLSRISIGQIKPHTGAFCSFRSVLLSEKLSSELENPKLHCESCAKGSLFLSYIGIVNNYNSKLYFVDGQNNDSNEMMMLSNIFTSKQLSLIETAFENCYYDWNEQLTQLEISSCCTFANKYKGDNKRLIAICENIIENKGSFKL